ncbi:hypothetical protein ANCCAN_22075 [Ancylostoma caninum]|uniref:Uncharacterized protein n=1 Tax=Ancylostoma caninum TaxID=29170 RepID=A0A368FJ95_ANCCA|nr:hypothetical protein ANCCAN_22075 [Ancylostoma caninum]
MIVRLDPCGLVCVLMIYGCVVYADYVVTIWMVMPVFGESIWGALHIAFFNTLIFMTLFSHARTMLTDPGVVPILKNGLVCFDASYLEAKTDFALTFTSP